MKDMNLASLRINYNKGELLEQNIGKEPFALFQLWMEDAKKSEIKEPNAMVLSTIKEGKPSARVVLLKGFDSKGFIFYTNYNSHKGLEMAAEPFAGLTFFWDVLERQVRIEGKIRKIPAKESDEYFHSRPRESQIGAWVSIQSSILENREILDEAHQSFQAKFKETEIIPRPAHWGGYILEPTSIEFWQGRPSRLHDRIRYIIENNNWKRERLSP
jgi:pyridoxamine 5'-phosphate oxidase